MYQIADVNFQRQLKIMQRRMLYNNFTLPDVTHVAVLT